MKGDLITKSPMNTISAKKNIQPLDSKPTNYNSMKMNNIADIQSFITANVYANIITM